MTHFCLPIATPSPAPLTNGDCIKSVTSAPSDSQYNWALIQAYSLALRNKVMFHPADLANETTWAKWVRPMTDCHIKLDTVTSSRRRLAAGGTEYNSASICTPTPHKTKQPTLLLLCFKANLSRRTLGICLCFVSLCS